MKTEKSKGHILAVDDEVDLLETIRDLLMLTNYEVTTANNGLEAVELLDKNKFDLIISDMNMPKMDGVKLVEMVKLKYSHTPIILLSGFINDDIKVLQSKGACAVLTKPITLENLLKAVDQNLKPAS